MEKTKVIDTNILIKEKTGLTTIFNIIEHPNALDYNVEILWPDRIDYLRSVKIGADLFKIGKPIPAVDIVIAAMCINRNLILVTRDKHFESIALIEKDFKFELK